MLLRDEARLPANINRPRIKAPIVEPVCITSAHFREQPLIKRAATNLAAHTLLVLILSIVVLEAEVCN